jgi:hypothetical protein
MSFKVEEQVSNILPPVYGSTVAVNCSTTVQVVDMVSVPLSKAQANYSGQDATPVGKFVRITAQGGDVYFVTGSNFALLNGIANTVSYTTVNATSGAVTLTNSELDYIPAGGWKDVRLYPANNTAIGVTPPTGVAWGKTSPVRYLALITASGNSVARLYQSSD